MRYAIAVLAIGGIAMSSLALAGRYSTPVKPIDLIHSNWNCAYVNQSPYAEVHGIPVAVLSIAGYAMVAVLALLRRKALTVYVAGIELAYALYVTGIESQTLRVWCVYGVSSLIIITLIAFLAFAALIFDSTPPSANL
jgi:vitamin-K-epoxide reductase (warfarin-sensitive)